MGASKKKAKKTAQKAGSRLRRAAKKALKNLGGPKKLKKGARKIAEATADALVAAFSPKKK